MGAAQAAGTVGCIALPNGGLAPLPGLNLGVEAFAGSMPYSNNFVAGMFVAGPMGSSIGTPEGDSIIIGMDSWDNSSPVNRQFHLDEQIVDPTLGTVIASGEIATLSGTWPAGQPAMHMTMTGGLSMGSPLGPGISPIRPFWAFGYWFIANPGAGGAWPGYPLIIGYPAPNTVGPGYPGLYHIVTPASSAYPAQVLTHQNRIVALELSLFGWPGTTVYAPVNELFNYTAPPGTLLMGAQMETFVAEHPFGAGAWGSINSGELFVVKNEGGGYVLSGDLDSPNVTFLGGIIATKGVMSRTEGIPIGFPYAVGHRGVWLWSGGSSSEKISDALNDDFYVVPGLPAMASPTPTVQLQRWGEWMLVSNDWLYDTNQGGWWKMSAPNGPHLWYGYSNDGNTLWASLVTPNGTRVVDGYQRSVPGGSYVWTSYPIPESIEHPLAIQKVVVRAQGKGTVTVTLKGRAGSSSVSTPTALNFDSLTQPQLLEVKVGNGAEPLIADDVTVQISSTGVGGPAPIVYEVQIGWTESSSTLVSAT
jgi:hypothetical protein